MLNWILSNAQGLVAIIEVLGFAGLGVLVLTGSFSGEAKRMQGESDRVAQDLISNYRITIEEQEKKISGLLVKEVEQGKQIAHLEGQLKVLADMVALRDPQTASVFSEAPEIFKLARENNQYSKANNAAIERLTNTIEEFINRLPPLMPAMHA